MMSAMDFGVTQIHLLPLAFRNPAAWARAFKAQFDMFIHPIKYQQWQAANREVISEMSQYGIQVGTRAAEMVEALGEGGILQKIPTLGRFETSFSGALSVGKVETWKALRKLAVGADGLLDPVKASEVASYVRAMTGTAEGRGGRLHSLRPPLYTLLVRPLEVCAYPRHDAQRGPHDAR